jgi:trk system potassium uptake protein TrkA
MRQDAVDRAFVVGSGRLATRVANRLATAGEPVTLVTLDPEDAVLTREPRTTSPSTPSVELIDSIDGHTLESVGLGRASAVLVLGENDATNLLVAQLARSRFGVDSVLVRVNDPERESAFERLHVETVDTEGMLADAILET